MAFVITQRPEVLVDAKHEAAEAFYLRYGFEVIDEQSWPHRLFLPLGTLRAAMEGGP